MIAVACSLLDTPALRTEHRPTDRRDQECSNVPLPVSHHTTLKPSQDTNGNTKSKHNQASSLLHHFFLVFTTYDCGAHNAMAWEPVAIRALVGCHLTARTGPSWREICSSASAASGTAKFGRFTLSCDPAGSDASASL